MSLETLLEAAKYLEYRSEAKARGEEPHDYHTFARLSAAGGDGFLYKSSKLSSSKVNVLDRSDTFSFMSDDSKDKRRAGGAGTREVHNKLEKNRRAHLKECFETLKKQLPNMDERKTSNLSILRGALRYIQTLKRKEREYEHEMERLAREKINAQQKLASLKKDLPLQLEHIDVNNLLPDVDNETTTTASECGPLSDLEDDEEDGEDEAPRNMSSLSKSPSSTGEGSPSSSNSAISMSTVRSSSTTSTVEPSSAGPTFSTSKSVISNINQTVSTFLQSFETPGSSSSSTTWPSNKVTSTVSNSDSTPVIKSESPNLQPQNLEVKSGGLVADHIQPSQAHLSTSEKCGISEANSSPDSKAQLLIRPNSTKMLQVSSPMLQGSPPKSNTIVNSGGVVSAETSVISSVVTMTMPSSVEPLSSVSVMPKTTVPTQSIRLATPATASSSAKLMTPMTLVTPQAVVNVTQVAAAASKPIIINQAAGMTRVTMVANPSSQLTLTPVNVKPGNALTTFTNITPLTTVTSTSNHQIVHHSTASVLSSSTETQPTLSSQSSTSKSLSQILHSTVSQRSFSGQQVLSSPVSSIANVGRHLVTTTLKPAGTASHLRSTLPQLAGVAHVAHVMSQAPVAAASVGQIVSAGTHMSPVTPIVAPLSVVSHGTSQMIPQRQQLGKVLTSPILKPVGQINQIPIIQRQFLQPTLGSVSAHAQPVVKPVVVVSMPNMVSSSNVVQQHSGQHTSVSVPVSQ